MRHAFSPNVDAFKIAELLQKGDDFCICGHTSPDGDCIGSTLAMKAILDALGKDNCALVADKTSYIGDLAFLPGADELISAKDFKGKVGTFIEVDVPNDSRMGEYASKIKSSANDSICIDHHEYDRNSCSHRFIDPDAASCTLIVWQVAKELLRACGDEVFNAEVMKAIATCCYAGLLTDTGRFMYQNTDAKCFDSAKEMTEFGIDISQISTNLFQEKTLASIKLNALVSERMQVLSDGKIVLSWLSESDIAEAGGQKEDSEGCINVIRALKGAMVACLLKERDGSVRGSLRAKDSTDVAKIASEFGGGGHKAAAGFTFSGDLDGAISAVTQRLSAIDFEGEDAHSASSRA